MQLAHQFKRWRVWYPWHPSPPKPHIINGPKKNTFPKDLRAWVLFPLPPDAQMTLVKSCYKGGKLFLIKQNRRLKKKKKTCLFFFPKVFKIKGLTNRKMLVNFKQQRTCHLERKKSEHCHMGNIKLKHFLISKPKHFHLENVKMRCFDMFKKILFYYLLGWKHLAHSVSINA